MSKHTTFAFTGSGITGLTKESVDADVQQATFKATSTSGSTTSFTVDTCTMTHRYGSGATTRTLVSTVSGTLIIKDTSRHLDANETYSTGHVSTHLTNIYWFIADEDV